MNSLKRTVRMKWRDTKFHSNAYSAVGHVLESFLVVFRFKFRNSCVGFVSNFLLGFIWLLFFLFLSVFLSPPFLLYLLRYKSFGNDEPVIALLFKLLQRSTTFCYCCCCCCCCCCLGNSLTQSRKSQCQMDLSKTSITLLKLSEAAATTTKATTTTKTLTHTHTNLYMCVCAINKTVPWIGNYSET